MYLLTAILTQSHQHGLPDISATSIMQTTAQNDYALYKDIKKCIVYSVREKISSKHRDKYLFKIQH